MNTKLKCILLDDEIPGLTYLKMLCEQIDELEVVKAFNNPQKLMDEMESIDFDLCITDIEMPEIDGLTLAKRLKNKLVIFTTAYKEYAADAFTIDAIDYITKPVTKERLQKAIHKALEKQINSAKNNVFITLNTDKGKAIVYCNQLVYVTAAEHDSRDKEAYLTNGTKLILKNITFESLLHQLPEIRFCRVHKKAIIALEQVQLYSHTEITMNLKNQNGVFIKIQLSETYRSTFIKQINI